MAESDETYFELLSKDIIVDNLAPFLQDLPCFYALTFSSQNMSLVLDSTLCERNVPVLAFLDDFFLSYKKKKDCAVAALGNILKEKFGYFWKGFELSSWIEHFSRFKTEKRDTGLEFIPLESIKQFQEEHAARLKPQVEEVPHIEKRQLPPLFDEDDPVAKCRRLEKTPFELFMELHRDLLGRFDVLLEKYQVMEARMGLAEQVLARHGLTFQNLGKFAQEKINKGWNPDSDLRSPDNPIDYSPNTAYADYVQGIQEIEEIATRVSPSTPESPSPAESALKKKKPDSSTEEDVPPTEPTTP
jgi:hypothetical protein